MKTIRLKKYLWKDWKFPKKKTSFEKQCDNDMIELGWERKLKIEQVKKRHKWLP